MSESRAQRTLVKSPPELWSELSDPAALARHLGEFGEIRITRLEPETRVEWEAQLARGSVELRPSGWGTKVTLTAELTDPEPPTALSSPPEPPPAPEPPHAPALARGPGPAADGGEDTLEPWGDWRPPEWPVEAWTTAGAASRAQELAGRDIQVRRLPVDDEPVPAEDPDQIPSVPGPGPSERTSASDPPPPTDQPDPLARHPAAHRPGFFARLFGWRGQVEVEGPSVPDRPPSSDLPAPPEAGAEPNPEPEPVAEPSPEPELEAQRRPETEPVAEPSPEPQPEPAAPTSTEVDPARTEAVLTAVLDDLGAAHHRPFSR